MTALRELLSELMSACEMIGYATSGNERANHRATRDKLKAELLSILDAEGDGGAVGDDLPGMWSNADFTGGDPDERCHAEHGSNKSLAPSLESFRRAYKAINPQPVRSGVVSDEDVLDAERYRWLRANAIDLIEDDRGNGSSYPYGDDLDAAIDAAIKSQGESNV